MQKAVQTPIREEELKNRVAAAYFGKYDCTRIVGNIDFCVLPKRRDPSQMTFISDPPILWAEAKNHPTDVHRKSCFKSHFMSDVLGGRVSACAASPPYHADARPYQGELEFTKESDKTGLTFIIKHAAVAAGDTRPPELQDSKAPSSESNNSAALRLCVKENLTPAARAVLDAGRELWRYYNAQPNANPNASYYDIRLHFQGVKKTASGKEQMNATSPDATYNALLANLRAAHKTLAAQIAPKVYEYGFLRR